MTSYPKLIIYTDGGSRNNPGIAGAGIYITDGSGSELLKIAKPLGIRTNNWAEYEAIITGLEAALQIIKDERFAGAHIEVRTDSQLAVRQINGQYKVKEPTLRVQFMKVLKLRAEFLRIIFTHIPREKNTAADALSNKAMDRGEKGSPTRETFL